MRQHALGKCKFARVADHRFDPRAAEQVLKEQELRVEILLFGRLVDNRDALWPAAAALQRPFIVEAVQPFPVQRVELGGGAQVRHDLRAAGLLRMGERPVEQGAAGVGVDLDELRAAVADMKIEAHENALRPAVEPGDPWRAREHLGLVDGQGDDGFHCGDDIGHGLQRLGGHERRGGREQVRAAAFDLRGKPEQRRFGLELLAQALGVEAAAVAAAVERERDRERTARCADFVRAVCCGRCHDGLTVRIRNAGRHG